MSDFDCTVAPADVSSTCRRQVADWTPPGVYATGGYAINPEDVRMGKIFAILFAVPVAAVAGAAYIPFLDTSTGNLAFVLATTGAEAAPGTAFADPIRVEVIGQ